MLPSWLLALANSNPSLLDCNYKTTLVHRTYWETFEGMYLSPYIFIIFEVVTNQCVVQHLTMKHSVAFTMDFLRTCGIHTNWETRNQAIRPALPARWCWPEASSSSRSAADMSPGPQNWHWPASHSAGRQSRADTGTVPGLLAPRTGHRFGSQPAGRGNVLQAAPRTAAH